MAKTQKNKVYTRLAWESWLVPCSLIVCWLHKIFDCSYRPRSTILGN